MTRPAQRMDRFERIPLPGRSQIQQGGHSQGEFTLQFGRSSCRVQCIDRIAAGGDQFGLKTLGWVCEIGADDKCPLEFSKPSMSGLKGGEGQVSDLHIREETGGSVDQQGDQSRLGMDEEATPSAAPRSLVGRQPEPVKHLSDKLPAGCRVGSELFVPDRFRQARTLPEILGVQELLQGCV